MYFEKTNKPWFGPRKRAKEMLSKARSSVIEPKEAIDLILNSLDINLNEVQHFKFYDFLRKEDKFWYTIVIVQTISNPKTRNKVYHNAMKCVEICGWYPLVQGERLNSLNYFKNILINENLKFEFGLNKILGYESACNDGDGTSIRLLFENGSILFDSALPGKLITKDSDKIVFLSHSHADHTGGILNLLNTDIKIIINKETYRILCSKNILEEDKVLSNLFIIGKNSEIFLDSYSIRSFPVPHCFGSIGFKADFKELELVFTGDIVIRTNRFDHTNYLLSLFSRTETKKYIFLDSTMCMRNDGASQLNTARELLNKIDKTDNTVVITSRDSEQLIYSLIDLFFIIKNSNRNQYSFILPRQIKNTVSVIHENFIKSNHDDIDKILYGQYGSSKSAWGESTWIYWIKYEDEIEKIVNDSKSIIFLTHNDIDLFPSVTNFSYLTIGKTGESVISKFNGHNLEIDTTPWTMHSSKTILTNSIIKFHEKGIKSILFHDYSKRMSKYIEQFEFEVSFLRTSFTLF